jgi:hypothetical protein
VLAQDAAFHKQQPRSHDWCRRTVRSLTLLLEELLLLQLSLRQELLLILLTCHLYLSGQLLRHTEGCHVKWQELSVSSLPTISNVRMEKSATKLFLPKVVNVIFGQIFLWAIYFCHLLLQSIITILIAYTMTDQPACICLSYISLKLLLNILKCTCTWMCTHTHACTQSKRTKTTVKCIPLPEFLERYTVGEALSADTKTL